MRSVAFVKNSRGIPTGSRSSSISTANATCYRTFSTLSGQIKSKPPTVKHKHAARNHWKEPSNQLKFFDELGKKIKIQNKDDWYSVLNNKLVLKNGGRALLTFYSNSSIQALMSCYPEHEWKPWMFQHTMRGYWTSKDTQKDFFDNLGKKLGVKELDDWYHVLDKKSIVEYGGETLLRLYGHSPIRALVACYPQHNWIVWKFKSTTHSFWNSRTNVAQFIAFLSEKLSIQTLDDWYRVDRSQIQHLGGSSIIRRHGGMIGFLREYFPHHPWDSKRFATGRKAQRWLVLTLMRMFPGEEIREDYQHPKAKFASSGRTIQLDVYVPSRSLAFEYHGKQHFEDVGFFQPSRIYQKRDEEKRQVCAENNIKLVEVPYWWNRTEESLQEMIDEVK